MSCCLLLDDLLEREDARHGQGDTVVIFVVPEIWIELIRLWEWQLCRLARKSRIVVHSHLTALSKSITASRANVRKPCECMAEPCMLQINMRVAWDSFIIRRDLRVHHPYEP